MRYQPGKLKEIAEKLGVSPAALEQYLRHRDAQANLRREPPRPESGTPTVAR